MIEPPAGLKDVAARAGVSIKTVSNVVHDYKHVSESTRQRVQAAISELNYSPNLAARNLRLQRSGLMALALPELDSPYFAEMAHLIVEAAAERGFTVLVDQTGGDRERELLFIAGIRAQLIDALVFTPLALTQDDLIAARTNRPLVLLGEAVDDGVIDQVSIDSRVAGRDAVEHLISIGRRRIAAVGAPTGPHHLVAHTRRLLGYHDALAAAGLPAGNDLVAPVSQTDPTAGHDAMTALLALSDEPPDAVFCFNDVLALGAMRALHTAGLRIPQDVAVIGFDDIALGRYTTPSISTIAPDKHEIARLTVELACAQLDEGTQAPRARTVGHRVVARESTVGVGTSPPASTLGP